jgi:hypothetical protein
MSGGSQERKRFELIERFTGNCLGHDLSLVKPGSVVVSESPRRLKCEASYGYVHALWWTVLEDGRSVISVPPGAGEAVRCVVRAAIGPQPFSDSSLTDSLKSAISGALAGGGLVPVERVFQALVFACDGSLVKAHTCGDCRRLTNSSIATAKDLTLPSHLSPERIAYGIVSDGSVLSVAYAHLTGVMEDLVADIGVETASAHRKKGYGKTVVSAVVKEIASRGGVARYACSPANAASVATAKSVGFVLWARSLIMRSRPDRHA